MITSVYIGLDQALANTGLSYVSSFDNYKTVRYQTIVTKPSDDKILRISKILDELNNLIVSYDVKGVFMEEVFYSRNLGVLDLIRVEAVIKVFLHSRGIPYYSFSAINRKSLVSWPDLIGSKGTKGKVLELLVPHLKEKINEHEADSIGILLAGLKFKGVCYKQISEFQYTNNNKLDAKPRRTRATKPKSVRTTRKKTAKTN